MVHIILTPGGRGWKTNADAKPPTPPLGPRGILSRAVSPGSGLALADVGTAVAVAASPREEGCCRCW
jgi:hypothetical protein